MNNKFGEFLGALIFWIGKMLIIAAIIGYPVMWLWNYTMPYLFGIVEIDFWHALALELLCGILFKPHNSDKSKND